MCSVGRVNVFSFGGNVSSFRPDVSSFRPNVFTLAGHVFSFRRRASPRFRRRRGGEMPRCAWNDTGLGLWAAQVSAAGTVEIRSAD